MSLITQCPACTTLFKVVPDQLRMSDGWVRCGQCDEVFDANENIRADVAVTESPVQTPSHREAAHSPVEEDSVVPDASQDTSVAVDEAPGERHEGPDPFLDKSAKELSDFSAAVSAASLQDELRNDVDIGKGADERRYMQMFAPQSQAQEDPKLSFMKPVRRPSVWMRRSVRVVLAVGCIALATFAALQVVVHERNRLAVQYPEFRGQLAGVCALVGLEIEPMRQIESVVIDSSAFSKIRNDVYKLSFTLRNTSGIPLATPAMELTLTDLQDQVLLRKVLNPSDFAGVPAVIGGGTEVNAALPLSVRAPVPVERVSGYRLLAFYP